MNFDDWYEIELNRLQDRLEYVFDDISLLRTALLHSSHVNEHGGAEHNERLEFLGDAVLQLSVSRFLYRSCTNYDEGMLSKRRASIVCGASLRLWSEDLGVCRLLRMSKGMAKEAVNSTACIDAAEAVFGAVFLDGGFEAADRVIQGYMNFHTHESPTESISDPKSSLQIMAQERGVGLPLYETLSVAGPSHKPVFHVRVILGGIPAGEGVGPSRKTAEFNAAIEGLAYLSKEIFEQ
jgi:ribonuclease-3